MDKNAIKKYAIWARRELIERVTQKAEQYEIKVDTITPADADGIYGRLLTDTEKKQRQALIKKIQADGFEQVMEEVAYTWFNRFCALRFMEVNGYLPTRVRVFTDEENQFKPQILSEAINLDLDGLDINKVYELKNENKTEELYKYLLIIQCNALSAVLPRMFQKIEDYTELLLPDYLLREGSVIEHMIAMIPEEDWTDQVQIIGWLYQYYNTEPKDAVFAALKKNIKISKENIPAATQLFTPDWIVRYMVENSLGRLWLEGHPNDNLKSEWKYYLDEAEQEEDVQKQLDEIRKEYARLKPEDIRCIDPCMGSGHILCYMFDVLVKIYEDYGYTVREAVGNIVDKNLWGLDIDERAAQLSYFAVMMKARQYDRRFFSRNIQPNVYSPKGYADGEEFGSLLMVDELEPMPQEEGQLTLFDEGRMNRWNFRRALAQKYHVVCTNPPYMGASGMNSGLAEFIKNNYADYKSDFFSAFFVRCSQMALPTGKLGFFSPYVWMFIQSYEKLRHFLCQQKTIETLIQFEYSAFEEATVPVCTFAFSNYHVNKRGCYLRLTDFRGGMEVQRQKTLEAIANHDCGYYYEQSTDNFEKIPGSPVAYWVGESLFKVYKQGTPINKCATVFEGLKTRDNERFLRYWFEVCGQKWKPNAKGGSFRRWYGNNEYVINWGTDGSEVRSFKASSGANFAHFFEPAITYSALTSYKFSGRFIDNSIFGGGGGGITNSKLTEYLLGFVNSIVFHFLMNILSQTLNFEVGQIGKQPVLIQKRQEIESLVTVNISISRADWDSFETSWDFACHPLIPLLWRGAACGGVVPLAVGASCGGVVNATESNGVISAVENHPGSCGATPPQEGNLEHRNTRAYASLPYNPKLKERARELRKAGNLSEVLLWTKLKSGQVNGWDFDRQKIIGNYIVDFYCANVDLVIEIDGESHDYKQEYDAQRDEYLQGLGLSVLHFSDIDVKKNIEGVVDAIRNHPAAVGGTPPQEGNTIEEAYATWEAECKSRFNQLKSNEEELNRIFIDIYGLQDELTPEVEDKDVTVRKADLQRDIKSLISYAVGCMFGRYSLDIPDLAYAGGAWDASKYTTFQPEKDAILPISDDEYFENDIVKCFEDFICIVYGAETLNDNLKFIADALGGKGQPREVIRNYFLNDFYNDHCKIYQKRPIYWLFDSGKKNGFKCLIYMHRYQPDTIARILTDYVHEQQGRYRTAMEDLEKRIAGAAASERVKLNKQLTELQAQAAEIREYEEKIHHLADQMIHIDLDDGVKVNYAKFQDVLAKIK